MDHVRETLAEATGPQALVGQGLLGLLGLHPPPTRRQTTSRERVLSRSSLP